MNGRNKTSLLSVVLIFTMAACGNVTQSNLALTVTAQALLIQQGGQAPAAANQNPANPTLTATPVSPSGAATATATVAPPSGGAQTTGALSVPAAPSDLKVDAICTPVADNPGTTGYTGTISWKDNSTDEEGFGGILGDVPNPFWNLGPNTTSINFGPYYFEDAKWPNGSIIVQVHAYNKAGASPDIFATIVCPTEEGPGAPSSAPGAPVAPSALQADFTCVAVNSTTTRVSGTISWVDNSDNETGFTVGVPYKSTPSDENSNGVSEYNLWPNSTSLNFSNDVSSNEVPTNGSISFYVIARGITENAPAVWNTVSCPPSS